MFLFLIADWCYLWLLGKIVTDWESAAFSMDPPTPEKKASITLPKQSGLKVLLRYTYDIIRIRPPAILTTIFTNVPLFTLFKDFWFSWRIDKCTVCLAHKKYKSWELNFLQS